MIRKLNSGARYVVVQTGWDMKKYQELLWFLRSRNFIIPLIARIEILGKAAADMVTGDNITDSLRPGVQLPLYVASKLARERELDDELFFNTQVERAAFIAAGCELMGYSGIQVAGLSNAHELEAFLDTFDGIMTNCQSYEKWALAWNGRFDSVTFVPFSKEFAKKPPYYLYNALLNPAVGDFSPEQAKPSQLDVPPPTIADKMQSRLADPDTPEWIKKTVGHWTSKPIANEDKNHVLGLENLSCPKRLLKGPCGDSRCDGLCPHANAPCFFQRILRLAIWNRQMEFLEGREQ
ncbi:MAG: methylenetetrahydrofolate reductase C-terminal domain-containing protein [Victivallales bacterium]|nr:methylenetetrahydrofolate reductase C-terminal domain-containing protein [Victivallales bacterium]